MPINYGTNDISSSGNVNISGVITAISGIFNRLGVGINTPLDLIHVSGSSLNAQGIRIDNGDGHGGSIQADNGALFFKSPTATAFRVQAAKIRLGDGVSSSAIELGSNGSISQDGNGGGLTFSGTTAQFSNGINVTNSGLFNGDVTANGSFIGGSGTASLPSFEFVNDPDTGLFNPAANTLAISTSGVERLRVDSVGNVGVGGSAQAGFKLDVNGSAVIRGSILTNSTISEFANARYQLHSGSASNSVSYVCNGGGRFGVGFTAPSGLVAISGGVSIGAGYNLAPPTNGLIVQGNIGVGTNNPTERLEVAGNIKANNIIHPFLLGGM
jgi:hypothetical protein